MEHVKFKDVFDIYEKQISLNIKNKRKLRNFEKNKLQNLATIYEDLKSNNNYIHKYNIFLINEPKKRIVMFLNIHDKIINHYVTEFILIPKLDQYLDIRNIATRKNMGSDYGVKLVKKYLEKLKKHDQFYVLKIDIAKYFYSIDHDVLKQMLYDKLTLEEYNIISLIIDSTNEEYIYNTIKKFQEEDATLPNYEYGKGLPIGNLTSQFLSIFYLYALDHYIIHVLHLKYYVRYMDDFIMFHEDKKYLEECLKKIEVKLNIEYKLKVNKKKTRINNIREGFDFLGYKFKVHNKKTIIKIKQSTLKKVKERIKEVNYLYDTNRITFAAYFATITNYIHSFKYANDNKIKNFIKEYF